MGAMTRISDQLRPAWRFERWIEERVRRLRGFTELPLRLQYRHIYVMPTQFGVWFGILLAATAVGGLNFNNNMAILLGFTLAAVAQLTTLLAYRNLAGLILVDVRVAPVFAGQAAQFVVYLSNPEARYRFSLQVRQAHTQAACDLAPQQTACLTLEQAAGRRGWIEMPLFAMENRYPLGLFRAWSVIIPAIRGLVYPRPDPRPPPLPRSGRGNDGATRVDEGEHFHGLREYRAGDSVRSIAWRTSARHEKLYTREMESPNDQVCELNWYLMDGSDPEQKLSTLTAWVLAAERRLIPYSLELPGNALPAGLGENHRDACLKMLALHGL